MTEQNRPERDAVTGVETTGHEWDGIKELNNPAPRWWLWVFFITVAWSVWYWVIYPAWPTPDGNTKGSKEWTQYKKLKEEQAEIAARRGEYMARFKNASLEQIQNDPELYAFAIAGGKAAFKDNCATCHGSGGAGGKGYPNLNDDDWLWAGDVHGIYDTIRYGVRAGDDRGHLSEMPAFGDMLSKKEIAATAEYVLSLSGGGEASELGATVYQENCAACHGEDGRGGRDFGAPNLADAIWLYGGTEEAIANQIRKPRHGVMPHWVDRLDDATIRQLTIYVHSLGGGE